MSEVDRPSPTIAEKATLIIASRAITILARVLSLVVLTRVLSKENFGYLTFILLAYTTVTTLAQLGLPDSVFYFFGRIESAAKRSFVLLTSKLLFGIGLGCSLILVALALLAPLWGFPVGNLFLPLIALVLLELPTTPTANVLIAIDRAREAARFNIAVSLTLFVATVVPALLGQPISVIVYSLVGYGVVRLGLSARLLAKYLGDSGAPLPRRTARDQLAYSIPLGAAQILWAMNRIIDKYVVAGFLSVAVYAEYVIGAWEIPLIPMIAYSVAAVMMPDLVTLARKGETRSLLSLWFKSIEKVAIIVLPAMVLFLIVAEEFIAVVFSEDYVNAALPFRIYTLLLFQRVTSYSAVLKAVGDTRAVTNHAVYQLLANVALTIPLLLLLGVAGPPTTTLVASVATWFYLLHRIRLSLSVDFSEVFPFGFYLRTLAVAFLAALPVVALDAAVDSTYALELAGKIALYMLSYFVVSNASGIAKREDWTELSRLLGLKRGRRQEAA
jgi:O-antigen/teichoic acid export membrane protein